jgi:2-oxoglutarate ferredoxin oxidoreductase subunit beta
MNIETPVALKANDYKSDLKPVWCPGCGDYSVLSSITKACAELQLVKEKTAFVSGIGCSSRIPAYTSVYGFHSVHGRSLAVATGLKMARPDLTVIVAGGDGDGFSIGGNHFLHACRRNVNLTYIVMDNRVYGMTKGQASPTTESDWTESDLTPEGPGVSPILPLQLALTCGANFIARGFAGDPNGLARLIVEGIKHPGFSLIQVLSPCITYRPEQRDWKSMVHGGFEPTADSREAAQRLLDDDLFTTGILYAGSKASFSVPRYQPKPTTDLAKEFKRVAGMDDVGEFMAHALALENEAASRYDELAGAMEVHNNKEVAVLFKQMADFSRKHAAEVAGHAANIKVPHLAPWEFRWPGNEPPESSDVEASHYLMTPYHGLQVALRNESRGQEFYARIAATTRNDEVRKLAATFALEEATHVAELEKWFARYPAPKQGWDEDSDPAVDME